MQRILLIQLRQLGDILLTTPAIRAVKETYPDCHLSFLAHPMGKLVLEGNPLLDELLVYDTDSVFNELKLISYIRACKFDLVFDFMNNPRSAFYTFLANGKKSYSFDSKRRFAYDVTVSPSTSYEYIVREKMTLLQPEGIGSKEETPMLPVCASDYKVANKLESIDGWRQASLRVILSPTHRREVRQWPKVCYAELADKLVSTWGASVLWVWGPGEEDFIDQVMSLCLGPGLKCPPTKFRELAAVMDRSDLFIGNSNGPSHVAVSMGLSSLQLHGPTRATAWCPMNELHRAIQGEKPFLGSKDAMESISVERVWAELSSMKEALEKRAQQRKEIGGRIPGDEGDESGLTQ